jgi:hypothetical protein
LPSQELILGAQKTVPDRIPEDFFFSFVFQRNFSQERGFGGVAGIPVFLLLQEFLQEFLRDRNSCIYSGFLQIPDPANCCLARPATKEGSLVSKIWTKVDLFQPLSQTGLDHGVRCPLPLLAPPGLKGRAAAAAEAVMAEGKRWRMSHWRRQLQQQM